MKNKSIFMICILTFLFVMSSTYCFANDVTSLNVNISDILNYQDIVNCIAEMFKIALPIGIIFNLSEWILTMLFKMAFPKRYGDF